MLSHIHSVRKHSHPSACHSTHAYIFACANTGDWGSWAARAHLSAVADDDANAVACCRTAIPPFDDPAGCAWVTTGLAMALATLPCFFAMLSDLLASIPSRVTAASYRLCLQTWGGGGGWSSGIGSLQLGVW
jgi:hypothetical protein